MRGSAAGWRLGGDVMTETTRTSLPRHRRPRRQQAADDLQGTETITETRTTDIATTGQTSTSTALSRQEHANKFNGAWRKPVEAIFQASSYLIEAKRELEPQEFEAMLDEDLLVSGSTARKIILIAQNQLLCAHVHKLPPHGARFTN